MSLERSILREFLARNLSLGHEVLTLISGYIRLSKDFLGVRSSRCALLIDGHFSAARRH